MQTELINFAKESGSDDRLAGLLGDLAGVIVGVAEMLKGTGGGHAGTQNIFGENQLKADVAANDIFLDMLKRNAAVASIASEELEGEEEGAGAGEQGGVARDMGSSDGAGSAGGIGKAGGAAGGAYDAGNSGGVDNAGGSGGAVFSVAFDPLDGSSLVDANLAVGSIIGVYPGRGFIGRKGDEQVAAMIAVYGPRLTLTITTGKGAAEFLFDEKARLFRFAGEVKLSGAGKIFAPGNLRACSTEKWYLDALSYWAKNGYTLRYSGGMVPDVNQILVKGGGIFCYPGYAEKPDGKLRLLYECAPMAFLMEQAGGAAVAGSGLELVGAVSGGLGISGANRILDLKIDKLDRRTPIFLGTQNEVELALSFMR